MIATGNRNKLTAVLAKLPEDKIFDMTIEEHEGIRGLNANAYYWQLLRQYAAYNKRSDAYEHNDILAHYGVPLMVGNQFVFVIMRDTDDWMEWTKRHVRPTSETHEGDDGEVYRTFLVIKGSHEYTVKQFSRIIDGLIAEIQGSEAPIETMTPYELEQLRGYEANTRR